MCEDYDFDLLILSHVKKLVKKIKCETKTELINNNCNLSDEEIYVYILIVFKKINTVSLIEKHIYNSHKSNISRIIKNLLNQNYINQIKSQEDKRIKYFTVKNEDFKNMLLKIIVKVNDKYKQKVTKEEYEIFLKIINKIES